MVEYVVILITAASFVRTALEEADFNIFPFVVNKGHNQFYDGE